MDDTHDIQAHVRTYIIVFVALMFLTVVTVAVSYLKVSIAVAVTIALIIASIKASLVACYFMHLISERKLIYCVLVLTLIFFMALMLAPTITTFDNIKGSTIVS